MPRTLIPLVYPSTQTGGVISFTPFDTTNGMSFPGTGRSYLAFNNAGTADVTVAIEVVAIIDGNIKVPDRVLTVPAGQSIVFGPFNPDIYAHGDDSNNIYLDSQATTLGVAAISAI